MPELLAIVAGLLIGFVGARVFRRPAGAARAASMARSVGGAVGTRRDLDLARLQRSVFSEMMRHLVSRDGVTSVPTWYRVLLHPDDHATAAQAPGFFTQGLADAMAAAGREHGWNVPAGLQIELTADPVRRRGVPAVEAHTPSVATRPSQPSSAGTTQAPRPARPARLERRGVREATQLKGPSATIGRGTDRTIRVDDSRASRHHAVLRRAGASWTLTDEGSSNGTRLGGQLIEAGKAKVLRDGDEIGVGPVTFVFRSEVPASPAPYDHTRAAKPPLARPGLDDEQRRSISQDFFPVRDAREPRR